jgi:outer membrane protein assembly factor BamD (BamD/ComL family)
MKPPWKRAGGIMVASITLVAVVGCGKSHSPAVAAEQLQRSYEKADAPAQQDVARASAALQTGDYAAAIITMERVTKSQPVDEAQKQAVSILIQQTRQAVKQNPKLNSPELYKAMSDLVARVHGEN